MAVAQVGLSGVGGPAWERALGCSAGFGLVAIALITSFCNYVAGKHPLGCIFLKLRCWQASHQPAAPALKRCHLPGNGNSLSPSGL